jgi:hypothetical protein
VNAYSPLHVSALGQKPTFCNARAMSALGPILPTLLAFTAGLSRCQVRGPGRAYGVLAKSEMFEWTELSRRLLKI